MSLHQLTRSLTEVSKRVGGEVQITTLLTFLFIAQRGTCSQKDVEEELGLTNASASRNVSFWTNRRFDRQPGMNFIERVEDDYDRRIRNLSLTPLGKNFLKHLTEPKQ